jgi:hypothetical protein
MLGILINVTQVSQIPALTSRRFGAMTYVHF